jgi:uncharacterized protein (TIGR00297 family)
VGQTRLARLARPTWPYAAAAAVGLAGWWQGALTADGAAAATAVGGAVLGRGGPPAAVALVTFFVSGSALSRFKSGAKERRGVLAQAKGGRRDAAQVLANGGSAALCLALLGRRGQAPFLGALATAAADTWATELGLLARRRPRLITSGRPVGPGTSGGVTPEGSLASLAGALTTGAAYAATAWLQGRLLGPRDDAAARGAAARTVLLAAVAGTAGAGVDSLLGATVQGAYWCPVCAQPTETPVHPRCGQPTRLVGGRRWIDNDAVNALATAAGALSGAALSGSGARFG